MSICIVVDVEVATIVLVKHENKFPNQRELACAEAVHPDPDGRGLVVVTNYARCRFQKFFVLLRPL